MESTILVFGHAMCPGVPPLRGLLGASKIPHKYIDIHNDAAAAERVRAINHGNESVPTIVFPDGSTLTEPSVGEVKAKLAAMGYNIGVTALLIGNGWKLVMAAAIVYAVLKFLEVI